MTPFRDRPKTCPKCGGKPKPWYMDPEEPCGCRENSEHLHWSCERCRFDLGITAPMDADPEPEAAYVPPLEEVEIAGNSLDQWFAYARRSRTVYFDESRGWIIGSQGDGSRYDTREACESAVRTWYVRQVLPPVEPPEPPVEQPQGEGAGDGVGDGLEGLRDGILSLLGMMAKDCDGNVSPRDAYRHAAEVVEHDFDAVKSRLVAFERRDFELLAKHEIGLIPARIAKGFYVVKFSGSANEIRRIEVIHPDYLTALRAAIAEARRREGEAQDER